MPDARIINRIDRWKREAKQAVKLLGVTHGAALDAIARREGYANWPALLKSLSD